MEWYNEPENWQESNGIITVTTDKDTDFWRVTRHDFIADNAHFYYQVIEGDFTATVKFIGQYVDLYDQAGLMARQDETVWLKCGVEYLNGVQQASAVVTREFSDWSVIPLDDNPSEAWIRMQRIGSAFEVSFSRDGDQFVMIRECYLTDAPSLQVGIMCASPKGDGFVTRFEELVIESGA